VVVILVVSIILLVTAFVFLVWSKQIHKKVITQKKKHRIPDGEITYSDLHIPAKALFSKRYRIAGKPDFIVKHNKQYIPVEVKAGSHRNPQKNHVLQLATYCQLLEDTYRTFVPYGVIVYNDADFTIPFDPGLRFELESVIKKMRASLATGDVARNHDDPRRCHVCSMRKFCENRLA